MQQAYFLAESEDRDSIASNSRLHLSPGGQPFSDASEAYHYGRELVASCAIRSSYLLVCYQWIKPGESIRRDKAQKELIVPVT